MIWDNLEIQTVAMLKPFLIRSVTRWSLVSTLPLS